MYYRIHESSCLWKQDDIISSACDDVQEGVVWCSQREKVEILKSATIESTVRDI